METTTTVIIEEHDGDEVIIAFAQAVRRDGMTQVRLQEWIARHPAHARELCCHAASCWACGDSEEFHPAEAHEHAHATRVREIGLATLRALRPASLATAANPVQSLLQSATRRGVDAEQLAVRLQIPFALIMKLHRRLIAPDSIPAAFVRQLAETVGHTQAEIAAYLRQPPTLGLANSYRSDDTPQVGAQETFADALNSDPETTQAQAAHWLSLP